MPGLSRLVLLGTAACLSGMVQIMTSAASLLSIVHDEEDENDMDSDYEDDDEEDHPNAHSQLLPLADREPFDITKYTVADSKTLFRFSPEQILRIAPLLQLPDEIDLGNRVKIDRIEALCILLYRLSYPCRLVDIERHFQRHRTICSRVITKVCVLLYATWKDHLELHPSVTQAKIVHYAAHVKRVWKPCDGIYAFIDGSKHMMCRPTKDQEVVYSGHKRGHCCNWQALVSPDGLILSLFGPLPGSVNDITMLSDSKLINRLNQIDNINGNNTQSSVMAATT